MSDSLRPQGLQQVRLLCPPLSPGVCSDSCPFAENYVTRAEIWAMEKSSKSCDLWTHHLLPVSRPPLCGSPSFSGFPSDWWHKEGLLNHTFPKAVMQNRLYVTALLTAVSLSLFALEVLRFLQIMVDNDNASLKKKKNRKSRSIRQNMHFPLMSSLETEVDVNFFF